MNKRLSSRSKQVNKRRRQVTVGTTEREGSDKSRSSRKRKDRSGSQESDDPDDPGSGANPPSKGDEAQDKEKKRHDKEATVKDDEREQPPETEAERIAREAQEKITRLERQLKEARDAAARAAEEKAERAGEALIKEVEDEKAKKERQKEKKKEKKQRKKQSKEGEVQLSGEEEVSDEVEEEEKEKPEGESKRPEGESKDEGDKPTTEEKKPEDKEKSEEKSKPEGEEPKAKEEGLPKDKEPKDSWAQVLRKARKPRQENSKAAEKAQARSYPRPMCEPTAKPDYAYPRPQHVPTREQMCSGKWIVSEKPRDVQKRNVLKLSKEHAAIWEFGVRSRYTDYKICVIQAMNAKKQTPPRGTPFTLDGPDTYWVQTKMLLHEEGTLPFSELPGMYPRLYTFNKFWDIPRRQEGRQLEGVALGVAQYVVGTFELDMKRRAATVKAYVDKEPFWLNMEAFKAARVLNKEISGFYHQEDMGVLEWPHAFVYHPAEINFTRALQERFPKQPNAGRWVHLSALVEHLYSVRQEGFNSLPFHTRGFVRMVPKEPWEAMSILASLMEPEFQMACDEHGFVWVRT